MGGGVLPSWIGNCGAELRCVGVELYVTAECHGCLARKVASASSALLARGQLQGITGMLFVICDTTVNCSEASGEGMQCCPPCRAVPCPEVAVSGCSNTIFTFGH
jgi:hypothetical protein